MKPNDNALLCRGACQLPATATGEMMFMPGGLQTITPFAGGIDRPITVLVDAAGAEELERQRGVLAAKGTRPYFDFEHSDNGASYWPSAFFWKDGPEPGIYCRGEWTADGKAGVEGKTWRMFSPVFHVDNKMAHPARVVCRDHAAANMGGLVNDPAFKTISPLWAKNAGGAQSTNPNHTKHMDPNSTEALQNKIAELEKEIATLKAAKAASEAKGQTDEVVACKLEAKEAQLKASAAELELTGLKAKNAAQESAIQAHNAATAEAAVAAAVERGVIAAKDADTIAAWKKDITADPSRAALLAKMGGNPALQPARMTSSGVRVTENAPNHIMKAYGEILAANAKIPLTMETAKAKGKLARDAAAIFAKDIAENVVISGMSMEDAIKAADFSDPNSSVGMLSGSLVLQKALPLMVQEFPVLGAITADMSEEVGLYNQTQNTRIVLKPAVQTFDGTSGTDGRPKGWATASPAQAVDVPVTLSDYVGVPIVFGANVLSSSTRKLFDEQAPMALYAIGGYAVDKLTGLMTAANFNGYAGNSLTGGATTSGSKSITFTSSTAVYPGQAITGTGIPANTYIASVESATAATLTQKATATGSALTFTLNSAKVPTTYATYAKAQASFAVADLDAIAAAFDINEVPMKDRFALLSSPYYRKLGSDSQVNALMTGTGDARYLSERKLPKISNFELVNAPYMPSSSNRVGFAGHKAAMVLKTRLPMDISSALAGAQYPGSVTTVTDPNTGLSVLLAQYVNPTGNYAEWRPELMLGVAVGDRRAGLVMTST